MWHRSVLPVVLGKLFFSLTSEKLTMFPCQYFHDVSPLGPIEPVIFHDIKCKTGKFLHLFLISPPRLPSLCHIELPRRGDVGDKGTVRQTHSNTVCPLETHKFTTNISQLNKSSKSSSSWTPPNHNLPWLTIKNKYVLRTVAAWLDPCNQSF